MRLPGRGDRFCRGCCGCWDCLPNILLQDADQYYHAKINQQSDLVHVFGGQGGIKTFRRIYVVFPLVILAAWVAYNAWAATVAAEGLMGQAVGGSLAEVWAEKNVLRLRSFQNNAVVSYIFQNETKQIMPICLLPLLQQSLGAEAVQ